MLLHRRRPSPVIVIATRCSLPAASGDAAGGSAAKMPRSTRRSTILEDVFRAMLEHRFGRLNAITLRKLSGRDYVDRLACEMREMVMAVCREKEVELSAPFRSEREDGVQAMVLARIGFAFMPEESVTWPGLLQRPLFEPEVQRTVAAVTMPG